MGSKNNAVFNIPVVQGYQPHIHELEGSSNVFINTPCAPVAGIVGVDTTDDLDEVNLAPMSEFEAAITFQEEPDTDHGLAIYPTPTTITPAHITQSISNGLDPNATPPEPIDQDDAVIPPLSEIPADCASDIYSEATNHTFPSSFQLSQNFALGQLSSNAVLSHYSVVSQHGLTTNEIVCNLRQLCVNVLEPLKALYPNMIVTSGFRRGSSSSQHERGQAADVQLSGTSHTQQWEAAKVVKVSVPYDQFILELGNNYWFHLSYSSSSNRQKVLTRTYPGVYKSGLLRIV